MTQKLYSIRDIRAKSFGVPFVAVDDSVAKRTVGSTLISIPPTHLMYAFASDFELCFLGEVNDDGLLCPCETGVQGLAFLSDIISMFKIDKVKENSFNGIQNEKRLPENDCE